MGVVRHVGRILDGRVSSRPCELLPDGDLLLLIERMLHFRGLNTVRISMVKGHTDEALVRAGAVRGLDKLGNDGADEAAAFGRRRVPWWDMDARQIFFWCLRRPIVLSLHRFFIAGTSIDPLVWSAGSAPKKRRVAVRDRFFVASVGMLSNGLPFSIIYIGLLLIAVLVWVVCLLWSCLFCMNFVRVRLELEKAVPRYRRPGRSISVSAVPFDPGTDIWRSCRFIGALFRGLRDLPFGLRRFVSCDIGANHCRLRHIGWERCGHGLTSRLRESASGDFLNRLFVLFGYPSGSAAALLAGVFTLRYCSARFACKFPT